MTQGRRRRVLAPALTTTVIAALIASGALMGAVLASKPRIPSRVSIHDFVDSTTSEHVFAGRVRSDKRACKRHRTVLLKVEGQAGSLGSDRTNRRGRWEIRLPSPDSYSGDFYARARRKAKENFVCKPAESERIHFGP
jgi:hypothetical protein